MSDVQTTDLVAYEPGEVATLGPRTLFGTSDPKEVVRFAADVATELARVIEEKKLFAPISGRKHVLVEGWTMLGSLLGVFPVCVEAREVEPGIFMARVEARTLRGEVVGSSVAICTRDEKEWSENPSRGKPKDDFALLSMAQTRATAKALRLPLGFVMTLAGYEATPAEELVDAGKPKKKVALNPQRIEHLNSLLHELTALGDTRWGMETVLANATRFFGRPIEKLADLEPTELETVINGAQSSLDEHQQKSEGEQQTIEGEGEETA